MSKKKASSTSSRREFLGKTASGLAAPYLVSASTLGRGGAPPPSDRIQIGVIGVNRMGKANLENCAEYPDVVIRSICDVDASRREEILGKHPSANGYRDYRELLADPGLDAVIIATPPHWHARMAVDTAEAGKDIYLQKPMTLYPDETLAVRNAINHHGRISQIGTQIHAGSNYRRVVEWVRSGRLGPITVVRTFMVMNQGPEGIGHAPFEDPPIGLDWNLWCGPAPWRPFNALLFKDASHHGSFWDYSGGWTPGMAPHIVDLPVWALGLDVPELTSCSGGRYAVGGDGDTPDTQEVIWQFKDLTMTWMMSTCNSFGFDSGRGERTRQLGVYFHGLNGTLFSNYEKHELTPEGDFLTDLSPPPESIAPSPGHEREWLDSIKSRKQPSCNVNYHWKIDLAIGLANLSYRLGRSVRFDAATESFKDDKEAARLARPEYRSPWKFPAEYLYPSQSKEN